MPGGEVTETAAGVFHAVSWDVVVGLRGGGLSRDQEIIHPHNSTFCEHQETSRLPKRSTQVLFYPRGRRGLTESMVLESCWLRGICRSYMYVYLDHPGLRKDSRLVGLRILGVIIGADSRTWVDVPELRPAQCTV